LAFGHQPSDIGFRQLAFKNKNHQRLTAEIRKLIAQSLHLKAIKQAIR